MSSPITGRPQRAHWWRRAGWLLLLWSLGVLATGLVAALLRALLRWAQ